MSDQRTPQARQAPAAQATGRYLRVSPRKVRRVLRVIRGLTVPRAEALLAHWPQEVRHHVRAVLKTATASAKQKAQLAPEALVIVTAVADEGPMWKRHRAASMGRATTIRKRTCHLRIVLDVARAAGGRDGT